MTFRHGRRAIKAVLNVNVMRRLLGFPAWHFKFQNEGINHLLIDVAGLWSGNEPVQLQLTWCIAANCYMC